ncbi:MAG: Cytochrome d ubiquinol oxidase subunit II (EC 1.10.3.-) [Olavius algarvensis Delta 4 endosymbiont]|nr:MAG: Cytochrome d ubiquinol oxidase subunit II (EC 1.10.3.-) [Olavius algarvensis Delta 4 endosymbiont]
MELQTTWFFLWGLIWALFFVTGGYDLGIGSLYPFLGKTELDKRMMINAKGPLWDGNQVWLLTAGGVTFAAFPQVYATMFSSLYAALMLILFALIIRGVSFEFRHQLDDPRWVKVWDTCIFIGSIAPAILFGVAFANIFKGIPFDGQGIYQGTLFTLLNPYGLLGGVLFLLLFMQHGTLWLAIRTTGDLQERAVGTAKTLWPVLLAVAVIFLIASWFATDLYENYLAHPAYFLVIVLAVVGLIGTRLFMSKQAWFKAWFASALTIIGCTFFGVVGLFPALFPSSINPRFDLTAFNASSSPLTLKIMLTVVIIFVPIVLAYQIWAYNLFKTKVTEEDMVY